MTVRVLILDTPHSYLSHVSGEPPVITAIENEDIWNETAQRYRPSRRTMELAEAASPDDFDLVIIGNNMGHGLDIADKICKELRPRTLIVWNSNSSRREQTHYESMGFVHFGSRTDEKTWYEEQARLL